MARKQNQNANGDQTESPGIDVTHENNAVVVRIPVKFYRRNGRQMVLAQNDASGNQQAEPSPNHTLIANLAKAYQWQEQLESGEYGSLEELAKAKGLPVGETDRRRNADNVGRGYLRSTCAADKRAPRYLAM